MIYFIPSYFLSYIYHTKFSITYFRINTKTFTHVLHITFMTHPQIILHLLYNFWSLELNFWQSVCRKPMQFVTGRLVGGWLVSVRLVGGFKKIPKISEKLMYKQKKVRFPEKTQYAALSLTYN